MKLRNNYWTTISKFKWLLNVSILLFYTNINSVVQIRVLLDEVAPTQPKKIWSISSTSNNLEIIYPKNNARKKTNKPIKITVSRGEIFINQSKFNKNVALIKPIGGKLFIDGNPYQGSIYLVRYSTGCLLINKLDIEDYICSVLHTESWPGWTLEVNKALAIACRTYAATKVLETGKKKKPFHIRNTSKHQTYCGAHHKDILRQAVEETRGVVIGYDDKPILAMFDGCCGGIVPSQMEGYNFKKAPYLARPYACEFCKDFKIFSWTAEFSHKYLEKVLKENLTNLNKLKQIQIKYDDAGIARKLIVKDHKTEHFLDGAVLYSLLKEIVSFSYSIEHLKDKIVIKGKGYGHHLGLCVWGAKKMVDLGWNHRQILRYYYPKTTFLKLQKPDTN
jgi:stage II sporulation protein D